MQDQLPKNNLKTT